jgi:hypothetical protein
MIGAFGHNTDNWIGRTIEMFLGEVEFGGKPQPAVLIKPLDDPKKPVSAPPLIEPNAGMGDDEIPF